MLGTLRRTNRSVLTLAISMSIDTKAAARETLLDRQDGRCAICQERTALCIDHDHYSGLIRGLLCNMCNTGLGMLRDNQQILRRSIEYLKHPPAEDLRVSYHSKRGSRNTFVNPTGESAVERTERLEREFRTRMFFTAVST